MVDNCDTLIHVTENDNCKATAHNSGISLSQSYTWNSAVGMDCKGLWKGYYVCVPIVGVNPITTTSTTTKVATATTTATTTTTASSVATPTPIQPEMTLSCKKFHRVVAGDMCAKLASGAGILQDQFLW